AGEAAALAVLRAQHADDVEGPVQRAVAVGIDGRLQRDALPDLPVEAFHHGFTNEHAGAVALPGLELRGFDLDLGIELEIVRGHGEGEQLVARPRVGAAAPVRVGHGLDVVDGHDARLQ